MNEQDVLKQSVKVYLAGLVVSCIVAIIFKGISYPLGFTLGYLVSVLSFYLIIAMSDMILKLGQSTRIVVIMFIAKTAIYAGGFMLALLFDQVFNIFAVFFGYLITRITITVLGYYRR